MAIQHDVKKELTYEFYSADRNSMLEVIQGLRKVVELLLQV